MSRPIRALSTLAVLLTLCPIPSEAATWCVGTAEELRDALFASRDNGQHDTIRLKPGTYEPTDGGVAFAFNNTEDFDLTLEGGYTSVVGNPCFLPLQGPAATVLSGAGSRRVLQFLGQAGTSGNITIRNLTVRNGNSAADGGGMIVGGASGYLGGVTLDRLIVRNNVAATFGGGIIGSGTSFTISNSLLTLNECGSSSCAMSLTVNESSGTVRTRVIGNTIVINTCSDGDCIAGGVRVGGSARAQIANNAFGFNAHADVRLDTATDLLNNRYDARTGQVPAIDAGNLVGVDARFADPLSLDFRLHVSSPLIDGGIDGLPLGPFDLDRMNRLDGPRPDIGAYEFPNALFRHGFESMP